MANLYSPKGTTGRYSRGNNVYNGTGSSPNPMGKNQAGTPLQNAAALKRKRRAAQGYIQEPTIKSNSLLTDKGGLYT